MLTKRVNNYLQLLSATHTYSFPVAQLINNLYIKISYRCFGHKLKYRNNQALC